MSDSKRKFRLGKFSTPLELVKAYEATKKGIYRPSFKNAGFLATFMMRFGAIAGVIIGILSQNNYEKIVLEERARRFIAKQFGIKVHHYDSWRAAFIYSRYKKLLHLDSAEWVFLFDVFDKNRFQERLKCIDGVSECDPSSRSAAECAGCGD